MRPPNANQLFAGNPKNLLWLFLQLSSHLVDGAEFHAECLAVMNASWFLASIYAVSAEVAQISWYRNLIPVEALAGFTRVILLPWAIIKNADAPLANWQVMLFFASYYAGLATSAVLVINKQCVISHGYTNFPNFSLTRFISVS